VCLKSWKKKSECLLRSGRDERRQGKGVVDLLNMEKKKWQFQEELTASLFMLHLD
jgi:hypothetical protein